MESWRRVWRDGFVPCLTRNALVALRKGLAEDDDRLTQGSTTTPPPLACLQDWPVEGCCGIGYAGWKGEENIEKVGDVELFFARTCFQCDQNIGVPAGCRWFLNWFDDTPRDEMRKVLIEEIDLALLADDAS